MSRARVKICGVTQPGDAVNAAMLGADAVGFVLIESAGRCVTPAVGRDIASALPPFVTSVALFADAAVDRVVADINVTGARMVQLHGHETPDYAAALHPLPLIKAVRVDDHFERHLATWRHGLKRLPLGHLSAIVLESAPRTSGALGGTGTPNDLPRIAAARKAGQFDGLPPVILAGGLTPDTVAAAIELVQPFAVDVSSGVELSRGRKDPELMRRFIASAAGVALGQP